jgi:hypothetical protein
LFLCLVYNETRFYILLIDENLLVLLNFTFKGEVSKHIVVTKSSHIV